MSKFQRFYPLRTPSDSLSVHRLIPIRSKFTHLTNNEFKRFNLKRVPFLAQFDENKYEDAFHYILLVQCIY